LGALGVLGTLGALGALSALGVLSAGRALPAARPALPHRLAEHAVRGLEEGGVARLLEELLGLLFQRPDAHPTSAHDLRAALSLGGAPQDRQLGRRQRVPMLPRREDP